MRLKGYLGRRVLAGDLDAALWLHAVYSHRSTVASDATVPTDARGIVLCAYDNMPDVTRPNFVK